MNKLAGISSHTAKIKTRQSSISLGGLDSGLSYKPGPLGDKPATPGVCLPWDGRLIIVER
jgi:hypothetical protein